MDVTVVMRVTEVTGWGRSATPGRAPTDWPGENLEFGNQESGIKYFDIRCSLFYIPLDIRCSVFDIGYVTVGSRQ